MNNGINLHDLLKKRGYDHGLISTFTFSPRFFEEYGLERFKALQENSNLTVFLDRGQYEEIIEEATARKGWSPRLANLRYLLHPIRVPGVFHPKVFLFAHANRGLLVIGSANFSQDGLGANAELVSVFEYERDKNESAQPLFQEAFQFFEMLVERWPSKESTSNVNEVRRSVPWLTEDIKDPRDSCLPVLLSNVEEPLWPQLLEQIPPQVDELSLVSRFFDASPQMLKSIFSGLDAASFNIYTQAAVNTMGPAWLEHPMYDKGQLKVYLCRYEDGEHTQQLHGKAYAFRYGAKMVMACGSANFSSAALLRSAASGNVEVLLLYPAEALGQLSPAKLFDPLGSAKQLKNADQLGYDENEPTEPVSRSSGLSDMINEAVLDENTLILDLCTTVNDLTCRISQAKVRPVTLNLRIVEQGLQKIELAPGLARKMETSSSSVQLGRNTAEGWEALSNPVLVAVPYGHDWGRKSKQYRRMQEAIESPHRFTEVLQELCESDDETRLRNFLTHCDIPLELVMKGMRKRQKGGGPPAGPPTEFKNLGARNLRQFNQLHEAAVSFISRHRKKLERHVECGTAAGIPNYLHILESMLRLLHSQIERAVIGLESEDTTVISQDTWKSTRDHLSDYYRELGSLLRLTSSEYVSALLLEEKQADVRDGFGSAVDDILNWIIECLQMRGKIDHARKHLKVKTTKGTTPAIFFHTQISDEKWAGYVTSLKVLAGELRDQLSA